MSVAALILAGGGSSRLGRPKQLEEWGEGTLLGQVVAAARTFPVEETWVVLGSEFERILAEVDMDDCGVVENPAWEEGIASSLRVGLDALVQRSRCEAVLVLMGDQPDIDPDVVAELIKVFEDSDAAVVIPKYRYTWGNPVVIDRSLWPRLMSLTGDEGARRLFQAHPEWVKEVWFERMPPRDVDTEADVAELRPRQPGRSNDGSGSAR